jgi:WhiB family redox-sensing transcriptional regulator
MIPKLTPPTWMAEALCAQVDSEMFFPEQGDSNRYAKRTCMRCDVRIQCLNYAVEQKMPFGVWGGLSERERRHLRPTA